MAGDIPTTEEIREAARRGRPIMAEDVSEISQAEGEVTGGEPMRGGPSATAHSLYSRQRNFENKAQDILSKPATDVTKDDARELQSAEARARGTQPGGDSLSADVQSLADENEQMLDEARRTSIDEPPPYITKDDARQAQSFEETLYGRQMKGGLASQMQSSADKMEGARQRPS